MKKILVTLIVGLIFFGIGVGVGKWGLVSHPALMTIATSTPMIMSDEVRQRGERGAHLTSPLLECADMPQSVSEGVVAKLKASVQKSISNSQTSGDITYASVYYRDLANGPWFGINESDDFFPASLLKLPLAMSFYWQADTDRSVLTRQITYKPDPSLAGQVQPYPPKKNLVAGRSYAVKDLIVTMLQESSNEAALALADVAGPSQIESVYTDLGLRPPQMGKDYKIDTHAYASFFRVLYNATYLDRTASEEILTDLSGTEYTDGLVAGVPADVTVTHKFGSRQVDAAGTVVQLHDCGIVYAPKKPYILCVMSQGNDFTKLSSFIKNVSATMYEGVTTDMKN